MAPRIGFEMKRGALLQMNNNGQARSPAVERNVVVEARPQENTEARAEAEPLAKVLDGRSPLSTAALLIIIIEGATAFLYFARPVILPIVFACVLGMAL